LLQNNSNVSDDEDDDSYLSSQSNLQKRINFAQQMQVPSRQYTPVEQQQLPYQDHSNLVESQIIDDIDREIRDKGRRPFQH
jgi:uncharacterized protein (UPF0262 family)